MAKQKPETGVSFGQNLRTNTTKAGQRVSHPFNPQSTNVHNDKTLGNHCSQHITPIKKWSFYVAFTLGHIMSEEKTDIFSLCFFCIFYITLHTCLLNCKFCCNCCLHLPLYAKHNVYTTYHGVTTSSQAPFEGSKNISIQTKQIR